MKLRAVHNQSHGISGRGRRRQRLRRRRAAAAAGRRTPTSRWSRPPRTPTPGQPVDRCAPAAGQLRRPASSARPRAGALAAADLVFLALPHGASGRAGAAVARPSRRWSTSARTSGCVDAAAWRRYYGGAHAGTWTYGLPELPGQRALIAASDRVANTGCYAVAVILALAPLIAAGLVEADDVVVVAASRHLRGRPVGEGRTCSAAR